MKRSRYYNWNDLQSIITCRTLEYTTRSYLTKTLTILSSQSLVTIKSATKSRQSTNYASQEFLMTHRKQKQCSCYQWCNTSNPKLHWGTQRQRRARGSVQYHQSSMSHWTGRDSPYKSIAEDRGNRLALKHQVDHPGPATTVQSRSWQSNRRKTDRYLPWSGYNFQVHSWD